MSADLTGPAANHAAIKAHYLSLPNRTEAGWAEVARNPRQFNRVWNHLLKLPPSDKPPQNPRSVRENPYTHTGNPLRVNPDSEAQ